MKLISILLVLALLIAYGVMQRSEKSVGEVPGTVAFEQANVHGITLHSDFQADVVLVRHDDAWKLADDTPANAELVQRLLSDLAAMQVSRIVARSNSHDLELGMAKEDAVHLTLNDTQGQPLLTLDVGRQGGDLLSTFVRYVGDQKVLAVDKSLVWQVRRNLDGWRDVPLSTAPADAVTPMPEQPYQQP